MNAGSKTRTVHQLVDDLRTSLKAQRAGIGEATGEIAGPVFTFLIGAGFSVTAGVPSTAHLVRAMEYWMKHGADFVDCFENTKDEAGSSGRVTEDYFSLMDTVLSDVVARRTFIAAAIRWARQHKVQMNRESILLSTLLLAGAKREVPLAKDSEHSSEIRRAFARCVYTTSFDELLPTTFYLGNEVADILDTQVIRRVDSLTDYPSVVYLHGRHLHYDLRNTRGEIRPADHQEPSAYALCQQIGRAHV